MVLVDTSVWIALYRQAKAVRGQTIWALVARNEAAICGQVWVEFIGGFRARKVRSEFESKLESFPFLATTESTYRAAARLAAETPGIGAGDAVVAATAMAHGASLWTLDKTLARLSRAGLSFFTPRAS